MEEGREGGGKGWREGVHASFGEEGTEVVTVVQGDGVVFVACDVDTADGGTVVVEVDWTVAPGEELFVLGQEGW